MIMRKSNDDDVEDDDNDDDLTYDKALKKDDEWIHNQPVS